MNERKYPKHGYNDIKLSKSLSWLLRHGAKTEGINLDEAGFANVQCILRLKQFQKFTVGDVERIVKNNDKQRFLLQGDIDSGDLLIRANQGHSLPVNDDQLLMALTPDMVPSLLYHGTYKKHVENIKKYGLHRKNRNHIHFSKHLPGEEGMVSKIRKSCDVCVVVDSKKAVQNGLRFYKSDNDVILTSGNSDGFVLPICFKGIWPISEVRKCVLRDT